MPPLPPVAPQSLPPLPPYAAVDNPAVAAAGSAVGGRTSPAPAARDLAAPAACRLRSCLREVVHVLRSGGTVSAEAVNALRDAVLDAGFGRPAPDGGAAPRTAQEDPTEFFLALIDALGAPFLPLDERLAITDNHHSLAPCSTDERVVTERAFFLPVPDEVDIPDEGVGLGDLLGRAFGSSDVDGVRRVCARSGREVLVGGKLLTTLLPFYTPHEGGGGDRVADVDGGNFGKVALPLVLSRGRVGGVDKCRTRVALPLAGTVTWVPLSRRITRGTTLRTWCGATGGGGLTTWPRVGGGWWPCRGVRRPRRLLWRKWSGTATFCFTSWCRGSRQPVQ